VILGELDAFGLDQPEQAGDSTNGTEVPVSWQRSRMESTRREGGAHRLPAAFSGGRRRMRSAPCVRRIGGEIDPVVDLPQLQDAAERRDRQLRLEVVHLGEHPVVALTAVVLDPARPL
jgi:hypothetical protein